MSFEKVASKISFEERSLKGEDNTSSNSMLVARGRSYVKKNNETGVKSWKYGNIGHIKYMCHDGAVLEKYIESNSSNVSIAIGGDDLL